MALYQNDDLEFMFDNYMEMDDFDSDDDLSEEDQRRGSSDGDLDNYVDDTDDFELSKQKYDTSALDARNGKDIQGIPWERMNFTRDKYRETRLKQYKNYASLSYSSGELDKECKQVEKGNAFYDFQFNTRLVKSTIVHFQEATAI